MENLPKKTTKVSIVLASYNRHQVLMETIRSIRENGITVPYEIIVVDGASTDGALQWLIEQDDILTIVHHNRAKGGAPRRSWGYFINLGFKAAEGDYIVMVSDDCIVHPGSIMAALELMESDTSGKLGGCAFYWRNYPEDKRYFVGVTLGQKMFINHGMFARAALEAVGRAEEDRYRFYHADGDLCLKLWQAGYRIVDCPAAKVDHSSHVNAAVRKKNLADQQADWHAYLEHWRGIYYDGSEGTGGWLYLEEDADDKYAKVLDTVRVPDKERSLFAKVIGKFK